jgi:hypothetical protein
VRVAGLHRQTRLGAVERLNLALLVDRQHDGVGRRIDVEADHVVQLGNERRVGGQLEGPPAVRRQAVLLPDLLHRGDGEARGGGHGARRPVGRLVRRLALGQTDHRGDPLRLQGRASGRAGLVAQ